MNATTITAVQSTWAMVETIAPHAAALFYKNLFDADPSLKGMFKGNMMEQGEKLTAMIGTAVAKLDDLEGLIPVLEDLGRRHVPYGVKEAHYQTVGESLLKTLEQGLGEAFTPEVRAAWSEVYAAMAKVMISTAHA